MAYAAAAAVAQTAGTTPDNSASANTVKPTDYLWASTHFRALLCMGSTADPKHRDPPSQKIREIAFFVDGATAASAAMVAAALMRFQSKQL